MIDEKKLIERIEKQIELNTKCYVKNISDEYSRILDKKIALLKWMINLVKKQPKVNKWIPVGKRLPKENERVLVTYLEYNNKSLCDVAYIDEYGDWVWDFDGSDIWNEIIAWMPLPKEYEGGVKQ